MGYKLTNDQIHEQLPQYEGTADDKVRAWAKDNYGDSLSSATIGKDLLIKDFDPDVLPFEKWHINLRKTLDPNWTFLRDSLGTYINKKGILKTASRHEPRREYHQGKFRGMLFEDLGKNYVLNSNVFDETTTDLQGCTATGTATGPDDVAGSATVITEDSTINPQSNWKVFIDLADVTWNNTSAVASFFIKNVGFDRIALEFPGITTRLIDLEDNSSVSTGNWRIDYLANGWKRVFLRRGMDDVTGMQRIVISPLAKRSEVNHPSTNLPRGGGESIHLFGLQYEKHDNASSYISTSGSITQRNRDQLLIDSEHWPAGFDPTDLMTIITSVECQDSGRGQATLWQLGQGTLNNHRLWYFINNQGYLKYQMKALGGTAFNHTARAGFRKNVSTDDGSSVVVTVPDTGKLEVYFDGNRSVNTTDPDVEDWDDDYIDTLWIGKNTGIEGNGCVFWLRYLRFVPSKFSAIKAQRVSSRIRREASRDRAILE